MVQANPQILQVCCLQSLVFSGGIFLFGKFHTLFSRQPMLQELGKQNPQLMRTIQDHQDDFLRLINEPVEGEGYYALLVLFIFDFETHG